MSEKKIDGLIRIAFWGLASGIIGEHFDSFAISLSLILFGLALIRGQE